MEIEKAPPAENPDRTGDFSALQLQVLELKNHVNLVLNQILVELANLEHKETEK